MMHIQKLLVIAFGAIGLGYPSSSFSQSRLNFGLQQPHELIPQSRVPFDKVERKPKSNVPTRLEPLSEYEFRLTDGWELCEAFRIANPGDWYDATVPGTVLTSLVDQGIYPDPYWGLNNLQIPDTLCRMDWVYRCSFESPRLKERQRAVLLFNGINYKAEIRINGHFLGTIEGAFTRGQFDITRYLHGEEKNNLSVLIHPPHNPGIPQEANRENHGPNGGILCLDGPTFISSEGWDWMPGIRDRNIGLWQDVRLLLTGTVELEDPFVKTDLPLPDTTSVALSLQTTLVSHSAAKEQVRMRLQIDQCLDTFVDLELNPGERRSLMLDTQRLNDLVLHHPRLWWPNGYGKQDLYRMKISLCAISTGETLDVKEVRFGVRELEYELTAHTTEGALVRFLYNPLEACRDKQPVFDAVERRSTSEGYYTALLLRQLGESGITPLADKAMESFMVVRINGKRIFCKGGNWGMDDMMKRVSRERLEPYFRLHKEQHFTMIRNWTGESTEEVFYELCDEYGMLVLNDFWMSTEDYNLAPADNRLFLNNVRETVKRFRNHPSIAIWCPRNEGFAPDALERGIASTLLQEDGSRHYLPSSIKMNTTKSGPWNYRHPASFFSFAHGFDTEVGSPSLPPAATIRKMMASEDTWPIGDAWYYHDYLMGKWGDAPFIAGYKQAIDDQLGSSGTIDDFCRKAQLVNYDSYRAIFESWNSRIWNNTSGVLLWMSHPAWPSMVWQTYTYDYDTPGAYYGAKKACRPLHVQMNPETKSVDVVSTSLHLPSVLVVTADLYSLRGKRITCQQQVLKGMSPNSRMRALMLDSAIVTRMSGEVYFVKLTLSDSKGTLLDDNTYWCPATAGQSLTALNTLPKITPVIEVLAHRREGNQMVGYARVTNRSSVPAIGIRLFVEDVLPAYFDDGYFTLMPGESKEVKFCYPSAKMPHTFRIRQDGYNVFERE